MTEEEVIQTFYKIKTRCHVVHVILSFLRCQNCNDPSIIDLRPYDLWIGLQMTNARGTVSFCCWVPNGFHGFPLLSQTELLRLGVSRALSIPTWSHSVLTLPLNPLQPVQILYSLGRQCGDAGHNLGAGYVWLGKDPAATAHIFAWVSSPGWVSLLVGQLWSLSPAYDPRERKVPTMLAFFLHGVFADSFLHN